VAKSPKYSGRNGILSELSLRDFALLEEFLVPVDLPLRKSLETPNHRITAAYFLENGIASVIANGRIGGGVEVGLIGREGLSGVSVVLGVEKATYETFMQVAGNGQCIKAQDLKRCVAESDSLQRALLRYSHQFNLQVAHTAMINARSKIEERLARWLLAAHDRLDGDDVPLTHEFLATMLGVRRPGVTVSLHALQQQGVIEPRHRLIKIIDRAGLEKASNGAYAISAK
jgi:CRP-like cAMP-binding protein